jgi:outer membrane protein OmpA-like peptidoglycan-associated protein
MKLRAAIAPALAALLATSCASSQTASPPDRAELAERDKDKAQEEARKARIEDQEAHQNAQDADRARLEADQKARYAAAAAAQAERDAQQGQATGVAEPQPVTGAVEGPYPRVTFTTSSVDMADSERARLDQMADSLRAHPSRRVVIHAYADDTGDEAKDARLAQRRADAVAHYLENRGISGDRIITKVVTREVAYASRPESDRRGPYRSVEVIVKEHSQ